MAANQDTEASQKENERRMLERGQYKGKGIAVFTSGGDSQVCCYLLLILLL